MPRRLASSLVPVLVVVAFLCFLQLSDAAEPTRAGQHSAAGREVEKQSEGDWVDSRWSQTDIGQFLASNVDLDGVRVAKGLTIKVGEHSKGAVCFDTGACAWRTAWLGGFLRLDPARFGLIRSPRPAGSPLFGVQRGEAALDGNGRGVAPAWRGWYLHGRRVLLEYTLAGRRVLESPWLESANGLNVFTRTLQVAPSTNGIRLALANVGSLTTELAVHGGRPRAVARASGGDKTIVAVAPSTVATLEREGERLLLHLPAQAEELRVQVLLWAGTSADQGRFDELAEATGAPEPLEPWMEPGPARWLPELKTVGQRGLDIDFLAVDTLTVPYENPWKALFFLTGVDFDTTGSAYVCSVHGDVWRVTGIDGPLHELRWHRFATGLFQPLGLKVHRDQVFVLGRDQITRLHDRDHDGEADFYESFCNQIQTSTSGHDYVTCLEQDDAGRFYYVDPRGAHRVSADGQRVETLATGWRNPNGLGVSPDGRIVLVAPQQGEWTPSSQISEVKPGGYFGYGGPKRSPERPLGYDSPLCWIPHAVDNSSGSQVWLPQEQWGPMGGHFVHLLWGRCGMMLLLRDVVANQAQGAVVPLPGRLLAGPNRGAFNPRDGHLYVAGSTGWQTSAAKDGALQRVRYTKKAMLLPVSWHAHSNGLAITFSQPLSRVTAEDAGSFALRQWNYRYAAQYGSKDWSVARSDVEGRDEVEVRRAELLADGRTIFLHTPELAPVMQMEVRYNLSSADGKSSRSQFWLTLNHLDGAYSARSK